MFALATTAANQSPYYLPKVLSKCYIGTFISHMVSFRTYSYTATRTSHPSPNVASAYLLGGIFLFVLPLAATSHSFLTGACSSQPGGSLT